MFRRIVSLTGFLSFVLMLITSVILYIEPHGRVAYWAEWRFLWMSKTTWDELHITLGALFLVAALLHIWLNWKPIMAYMKNKAKELVVFTPSMVISIIITLYVLVGTFLHLPPMEQVLVFGESVKESHIKTYGNPPYGHAELSSLRVFCKRMGLDLVKAEEAVKKAGLKYTGPDQSIKDIALANGLTPQQLYEKIRSMAGTGDAFSSLPAEAPEGTGKMKLSDFCAQYGLDQDRAVAKLDKAGVSADPFMTIKDIASASGKSPVEVYDILRQEIKDTGIKPAEPADSQNHENIQGLGRMSLSEVCELTNVGLENALAMLKERGVQAEAQTQFKLVAQELGMTPNEALALFKE